MLSDARKRANAAYKKRAVRRVALEMQHEDYDGLKAAADAAGESVNGFIKKACAERIQKESGMIEIEHYLEEKDIVDTCGEMPALLRECIEGDADQLRRLVEVIQLHGRAADAGYPYEMLRLLARELFEAWRRAQHDIPEERAERVVLAVELYARGYRDQILPDRSGWRVDMVRDRMKAHFDAISETLGRDAKDFAVFYDTDRLLALGDLWESRWHDAHKDEWPI